jgi:hypothetical protein
VGEVVGYHLIHSVFTHWWIRVGQMGHGWVRWSGHVRRGGALDMTWDMGGTWVGQIGHGVGEVVGYHLTHPRLPYVVGYHLIHSVFTHWWIRVDQIGHGVGEVVGS